MSSSIINLNLKNKTLNTAIIKNNLSYIKKFELPISIAQYIDFYLIFNNVYINDLIIALDIKLNLWFLNYFKSYQLNLNLVIHIILDIFKINFINGDI